MKNEIEIIGMEETEALTMCACDTVCKKIIEALISGDDAQAGKVIRLELEYLLKDAANADQDDDADFTAEARETARKDALREIMGDVARMQP